MRAHLHGHAHGGRGHLPRHEKHVVLVLLCGCRPRLKKSKQPPRPFPDNFLVEPAGSSDLKSCPGWLRSRPSHRVPKLLLVSIESPLPVDFQENVTHNGADVFQIHLKLDLGLVCHSLGKKRISNLVGTFQAGVHQGSEWREWGRGSGPCLEMGFRYEVVPNFGMKRPQVLGVETPQSALLRPKERDSILQ